MNNPTKHSQFLLGSLMLCAGVAFADEPPNVDGRWTGQTRCPLGLAVFTIDMQDGSGALSHAGYGPERVHPLNYPIKPAFMKGWEGYWVYFKPAEENYQGGFAGLSGLLSANGQTIDVRKQTSLGDCQAFVLSRERMPVAQPVAVEGVTEPADQREPTEQELRQAVTQSLSVSINNPVNGIDVSVVDFKKRACQKSLQKPGYVCDYYLHIDQQFHSNEGTYDGQQHAAAVQRLYDWMINNAGGNKAEATGRFLYVAPETRWIKVEL